MSARVADDLPIASAATHHVRIHVPVPPTPPTKSCTKQVIVAMGDPISRMRKGENGEIFGGRIPGERCV